MTPSGLRLLSLFNSEEGTTFGESDLVFSLPMVVTESPRGDNEVYVQVTAPGYRGSTTISYFRLDLSVLFNGISVSLPFNGATTSTEIVTLLNRYYGTDFDAAMFASSTVTDGSIDLVAANNDIMLVGQITIVDGSLPEVLPPINELITQQQFDGFMYIGSLTAEELVSRTNARFVSYPLDLSEYKDEMKTFVDGTDLSDLADFLLDVTGTMWDYVDALAPHNLYGATVVYNGVISLAPAEYEINTDDGEFTHVLLVTPSPSYCSDLAGTLVYRYKGTFIVDMVSGQYTDIYGYDSGVAAVIGSITPTNDSNGNAITRLSIYPKDYRYGDLFVQIKQADTPVAAAYYPVKIQINEVVFVFNGTIGNDEQASYVTETGDYSTIYKTGPLVVSFLDDRF